MKAKKEANNLAKRLGDGIYKNGSKGIQGDYGSVDQRLTEIEKARVGLLIKKITFEEESDFVGTLFKSQKTGGILTLVSGATSGEWTSSKLTLPEDFLEFDSIQVAGNNITTNNVKLYTKTEHDDAFVLIEQDMLKSIIGKEMTLKVELLNDGVVPSIEKIELQYKAQFLLNRISAMEEQNTINLNKHNLRVNALLTKSRYALKDMIIDDFEDNSGIDFYKSTNVIHDTSGHKVKQKNLTTPAEAVFVKETTATIPSLFTLSATVGQNTSVVKSLDLTKGILTNLVIVNNKLALKQNGVVNGLPNYAESGEWESEDIYLGEKVLTIEDVTFTGGTSGSGSIKVLTATSNDGQSYSEYKEVGQDGSVASALNKYIKVKVVITSGFTVSTGKIIHDFTLDQSTQFEEEDELIFDGKMKLKTLYGEPMIVESSFVEEGTVLSKKIIKNAYKVIEEIGVN